MPLSSTPDPFRLPGAQPLDERVGAALREFYIALLQETYRHMMTKGSTVQGLPVVLKRVAVDQGVPGAETFPLPRLSRAVMAEQQGYGPEQRPNRLGAR